MAGLTGLEGRMSALDPQWSLLVVEFRAHAARDPELNERYASLHARTIAALSRVLADVHERAGLDPALPTEVMAEMVLAVGSGLVLERLAQPDSLPQSALTLMMTRALGLPVRPRLGFRHDLAGLCERALECANRGGGEDAGAHPPDELELRSHRAASARPATRAARTRNRSLALSREAAGRDPPVRLLPLPRVWRQLGRLRPVRVRRRLVRSVHLFDHAARHRAGRVGRGDAGDRDAAERSQGGFRGGSLPDPPDTRLAPVMTAGSAINFIPVPVTLPLTEIIDRLNRMQPVGLYGYPSMLARLAEERRAGRLDIDVAWVNSTSETLSPSGERRSVTRSTCPWSTTSVPPRG
jgi:hypothetical protein